VGNFFIHVVEPSLWNVANILHILRFKLNILLDDWHAEGRRKIFTIITVHKCTGDTIELRYLCDNYREELFQREILSSSTYN
jgi:hypothetical protein